jgi:cobalt-zinc-cadmium resistance protein CzcA
MIDRIVDAALNNRAIVIMLTLVLIVAGLMSIQNLPFDADPDISPLQVLITTQAPGLAPIDVERDATTPIELQLQGLPGMTGLRSVSRYGVSVVYVKFADGGNLDLDRNLVSQRLSDVSLMPGTGTPKLGPLSDGLSEISQFQVYGKGKSLMELRTLLDWTIVPRLRQVPGIVDVNVNGGELKTFEIQLSGAAMQRYGLSIRDVATAVENNNKTVGGATIERNGEQAIIRGDGLLQSTADIGNIVLRTASLGVPLYLRDVAKVVLAPMPRLGAVTRDGQGQAVIGVVLMGLDQNTRVVAQQVSAAYADINRTLPAGVKILPYYNRADLIDRVLHTIAHNLGEGAILVVVVLLLLLGNLRAGLIVALTIPLSMLAAGTVMYFAGLSGNLMSLGAIDFGLLVDGSVVMIENVVRRRAAARDDGDKDLVRKAAHEVARPVALAVVIITAVYLPILSLVGVEGKMFRPMAMTVIFALLASLVLTLTLMPVLASFFLTSKKLPGDSLVIRFAKRIYEPALDQATRRPLVAVAVAASLLIAAGVVASRFGSEFIPRLDEGALTVTTTKLPGISLNSAIDVQTMIEKTLRRFPDVQTTVTLGGSSEIPTDPMGIEQSDTFVILKPKAQWRTARTQDGLITAYSAALTRDVPGISLSWAQPIEMRMDDMLQGVQADVAVMIHGQDLGKLHDIAQKVAGVVSGVRGSADVQAEQTSGQPYLDVTVNREAIARYGLNVSDVLDLVEALGGTSEGKIVDDVGRFDIRIRMRPGDRDSISAIKNLRINNGAGISVPLGELANVRWELGPIKITHQEGKRVTLVQTNVRGRDLAGFVQEAQKAVAGIPLPSGYFVSWAGSFQSLQTAESRLLVVVPIALAGIFALLFITFRNARLAALIFLNVPFAAIGGIFALFVRGLPFSISAAIGFIALFGIAILNGVVMVSYIEERRR